MTTPIFSGGGVGGAIDKASELVNDKFEQSQGYADTAFNVALNNLDQVGNYGIDFDWDAPDPIPSGNFGLSGLNPVVPTEPTINQVSVDVATFTEDVPTMKELTYTDLTPPPLNFNWQPGTHNEDLQRPLKAKIIDGILNGGTGILPEVEQAIYDRDVLRVNLDAQNEELLALSDMSSRGARIPQGALIARVDAARLKNGMRRDDASRDVMIQSTNLADSYGRFIIEKGIALENELINLFGGIEGRRLDASKFTVSNLIEEFRIRVEGGTARLNADTEWNKQLMSVFHERIELFKAQLQANETDAEVQAKIEGLKLAIFDGNVKKFTAIVDAIAEAYKSDVSRDVANSEISLRHGDMLARIATAQAEINGELIKARSLVAAQLASAALGSVSAGANVGFSGSSGESNSASDNYSTQVSDSRSTTTSTTTRNCCNGE